MDHSTPNSWDIRLLQELLSTGNHYILDISRDPTMLGLINIIIVFPQKKRTLPGYYSFNKTLKTSFIIWACFTWSRVNLILCLLHFVIPKFIPYEIELPTSGKKIGFILLDDKDSTISYIIHIIKIHHPVNQLPTQYMNNVRVRWHKWVRNHHSKSVASVESTWLYPHMRTKCWAHIRTKLRMDVRTIN